MAIISYSTIHTAAAGESGEIVVLRIPEGRKFKLKRAIVGSSGDVDSRVDIAIYFGGEQILPKTGWLPAYYFAMTTIADFEFDGGTELVAKYVNRDTANARTFYIIVEGELLKTD